MKNFTDISESVRISLAERALEKSQKYLALGDHYRAKGKLKRADLAFKIAERSVMRFRMLAFSAIEFEGLNG